MRKAIPAVLLLSFAVSAMAQNVGDQATAGNNNERTDLNAQMGNFQPPLALSQTIPLNGVLSATSFLQFDEFLVIGQGQVQGNPVTYSLHDLTGANLLSVTFQGDAAALDYTPAYANDILLLGGPATSTVKAVRVSTPEEIWEDTSVGGTLARDPIVTNNMAIYSGESKVVAVPSVDGPGAALTLWEIETTTADAPLALNGNSLYFLGQDTALHGVDIRDGSAMFPPIAGVAGNGASLIADRKLVFFADPASSTVGALNVQTQTLVWTDFLTGLSISPGIALAYDLLFVFSNDNAQGEAEIRAYDPNAGGTPVWAVREETTGAEFAVVANNIVYYYNSGSQTVRARDAFTGRLLWCIPKGDVRALAAADGQLLVLDATSLEVYESVNTIFLPQIGDGPVPDGTQFSTLITLTNLSDEIATGAVNFIGQDGAPLPLPVIGIVGDTSNVLFNIPPRSTRLIQTSSDPDDLRVGWASVGSDQPIRGAAIFQRADAGVPLFEAGVSQSTAIGDSIVVALRRELDRPGGGPSVDFSTSLAVANPLTQQASLTLELVDSDGDVVSTVERTLDADNQFALFVQELFPDEFPADMITEFEGSIRISSDVPVAVTSLRTIDGFQLSSLPAGQER